MYSVSLWMSHVKGLALQPYPSQKRRPKSWHSHLAFDVQLLGTTWAPERFLFVCMERSLYVVQGHGKSAGGHTSVPFLIRVPRWSPGQKVKEICYSSSSFCLSKRELSNLPWRVVEMGQWVKCLLHKCGSRNLNA